MPDDALLKALLAQQALQPKAPPTGQADTIGPTPPPLLSMMPTSPFRLPDAKLGEYMVPSKSAIGRMLNPGQGIYNVGRTNIPGPNDLLHPMPTSVVKPTGGAGVGNWHAMEELLARMMSLPKDRK